MKNISSKSRKGQREGDIFTTIQKWNMSDFN